MTDAKRKLNSFFSRGKPALPAVVTRSRQSSGLSSLVNSTTSEGTDDGSASQSGKKPKRPKVWHPQQEVVLKQWAEIATSFRWLHHQAHINFSNKSFWITLPVIVISSITGTMNFAQSSFPPDFASYVPLVIGSFNLIAGVMTTVQSYLRLSELAEGHRVASVMFGKLSRNIRVELMLPTTERTMDGDDFIAMCRSELDRLTEQSPDIPKKIEKRFAVKFEDLLQTDFYPPELLQLHPVEVYRNEAEAVEQRTATVVASAASQFQRALEQRKEARELQQQVEQAGKAAPPHPPPPLFPIPEQQVAHELKTLNKLQAVSNLLRRKPAVPAMAIPFPDALFAEPVMGGDAGVPGVTEGAAADALELV